MILLVIAAYQILKIGLEALAKLMKLLDQHNVKYINELAHFVDAHTVQGINRKGQEKVYTARRMQEPDISPAEIGATELRQWQHVLDMTLAVRRRHPL